MVPSSFNGRISLDDVKNYAKECIKDSNNNPLSQLSSKSNKQIQIGSHSYHIDLIDEMYTKWLASDDDLDASWKSFFEGFELGTNIDVPLENDLKSNNDDKQAKFLGLIYAYRAIGHTMAKFNPLIEIPKENPRLSLERLGFNESNYNEVYNTGNYINGIDLSVKDLIDGMEQTYCGTIGTEY